MGTTANPTKTKSTANSSGKQGAPRVRASGRAGTSPADGREAKYDLLTAALLGLAIGAGTTLLLRRGPSGGRPISPAWRMASKGAKVGARYAGRGARYAIERGRDAWDAIPREEIEERMREYVDTARESIDHLVEHELKDLQRAIRRQRKKLGL